jgi:hypothetical protein
MCLSVRTRPARWLTWRPPSTLRAVRPQLSKTRWTQSVWTMRLVSRPLSHHRRWMEWPHLRMDLSPTKVAPRFLRARQASSPIAVTWVPPDVAKCSRVPLGSRVTLMTNWCRLASAVCLGRCLKFRESNCASSRKWRDSQNKSKWNELLFYLYMAPKMP